MEQLLIVQELGGLPDGAQVRGTWIGIHRSTIGEGTMRNTKRVLIIGALVVVTGLLVTACSSDPTTSDEYQQLSADYQQLTEDGIAVEAELQEARTDLASESKRAEEAEARIAELSDDHDELVKRLGAISADVVTTRSLLGVQASDVLTGDPSAIAALPQELIDLREELARTVAWFDTADEYHLFNSFRAYNMATGAIYDADVDAMATAWDDFWDADPGSLEEQYAGIGYAYLVYQTMIGRLDDAIAATQPEA